MYDPLRWIALCGVILLSLGQTSCSSDAQSKPAETEDETPAVPVEAAAVTVGPISAFFTGTASLESEEEAVVATKAAGVVTELYVEEGDYVREGQVMAKLDGERLALELARTKVNLDKLRRDFERNKELYDKKLISVEEHERVQSEYETQQAAFNLAQLELDYTTIRAPISGVLSERMIKVGNTLRVNDPAFHISDFDPLLAILHVPERELGKLRRDQVAYLRVDAFPDTVFSGRIERISPIVDATTGTFKVTVEVTERDGILLPGMFGRIRIVYDTREGAILVPKDAVIEEDEEAAVYVVEDGLAIKKTVRTGYANEHAVQLLSDLAEGVQVITAGHASLRDSSKVEVIP